MKKRFRGAAGQGPKRNSAKHSGQQGEGAGPRAGDRQRDEAPSARTASAGSKSERRSGNDRRDDRRDGRRPAARAEKPGEGQVDSHSEKRNGSRNSGRSKGRTAGPSSRTEEIEASSSRGSPRKGHSKRQIKNARSLSDVLGVNKTASGGSSSRPARGSSPSRPSRDTLRERPVPETKTAKAAPDDYVKPKSSKLQYIMNFIMPGSADRAEAKARAKFDAAKAESVASENRKRSAAQGRTSASPGVSARGTTRPTPNERDGRDSERSRGRGAGAPKAPERGSERGSSTRRRGHSDSRTGPGAGPSSGPAGGAGSGAGSKQEKFDTRSDARPSRSKQKSSQKRASKGEENELVQGFVKRHPDGYGFLIPDDRTIPDVYIARQWMNGVMTNDRVEAEIYQNRQNGGSKGGDSHGDRLFGEVKTILTHATQRVVGKYLPVDLRYGVILDEDHGWGADLRIPTQDSMGAVEGDMVAVEILQYPGPDSEFLGKVIERIGDLDNPINDVKRVIYTKNIPNEFSEQALADARKFGGEVTESEIKGREDLRGINLITIDGATARDFDDAIYVEKSGTGFRLVVAIADVSHYVKPESKLDEEAYERGTSTYFPNYVVPMLPEELSNELCSLKPQVTRLCFACEMHIDFTGVVQSSRFFEGVMESKARVTYGEAQEVVDGSTPGKLTHVRENILLAADLAKILMAKRLREGSLDLEIPETQVVVDQSGETVDIIKSERLFAHRLIEELMLVTNVSTAKFFDEHSMEGIFRIHEPPNEDNIATLQRYLWNFGGQKTLGEGKLQKKLTRALESMHGQPGAQVLNILTLRSMNQAKYSSGNVGHFGLGFDHYSHFTSPIRRYPDLIAHRQIKSALYPKYKFMRMTDGDLESAATMLSACEQRSVKAERMLISIKKARFMKKYVGEEFDGVISSVAKFGIFVLLRQFDADGLVKVEALGNDRFVYDEENLKLFGKRSGLTYTIGDDVRIRVAGANTELGKIDFELASTPAKQVADSPGSDQESEDLTQDSRPSGEKKGSRRERAQKSEPKRGARKSQAKLGRSEGAQAPVESGKEGADSKRSKNRGNSKKRGKAQDDSGSVRKERVSKSRRKD